MVSVWDGKCRVPLSLIEGFPLASAISEDTICHAWLLGFLRWCVLKRISDSNISSWLSPFAARLMSHGQAYQANRILPPCLWASFLPSRKGSSIHSVQIYWVESFKQTQNNVSFKWIEAIIIKIDDCCYLPPAFCLQWPYLYRLVQRARSIAQWFRYTEHIVNCTTMRLPSINQHWIVEMRVRR
jgi:hypothetical protein